MKWTHIILHHTGAEERDAEQIRRFHLSLGWPEVGYHYIVEHNGRVVDGRSLQQEGAHTRAGGMNKHAIGVAIIGNFELRPVPAEQLQPAVDLVHKLMQEYAIPVQNVLGHQEVAGAATLCPVRYLNMDDFRAVLITEQPAAVQRPGLWIVQAGAFAGSANAQDLAEKLRAAGFEAWCWFKPAD